MKAVAALCALALPAAVTANEVGHWYVTPQIGGISVDRDRPVEDEEWLYGLVIGKHLSEHLSVELNLNGTQLDGVPGPGELHLYNGSLDLLGVMNRNGRVSPYISLGAGVAQNERSPGDNATDFMAQAGLGLFIKAWESADGSRTFAIRPDIKARRSDSGAGDHLLDYVGTLGFQFSFGPAAAPKTAALPPPPPPPPAPEPEPTPPPPPPPSDSDKDGILDSVDKCPDTPVGVAVDSSGCPRQGSITLEGVTFQVNSAVLTADSLSILDGLAEDLKKYPNLRIELQGHTDSSGSDQYNLKLSQQRADSVREHLIRRGVAASQLVAKGYGETQPIADNSTNEGRAKNRRVVMLVLENPGNVKVEGEGVVGQ